MMTRRPRTTRQRIAEFVDDCWHKWDYHGRYIACSVAGGFALGVLAMITLIEIYWGAFK